MYYAVSYTHLEVYKRQTKGSKTLAKKKTLVKNIQSIQNLGSIDILCTDKTGTLTKDKITLQKYINVLGEEDLEILQYAYLNLSLIHI